MITEKAISSTVTVAANTSADFRGYSALIQEPIIICVCCGAMCLEGMLVGRSAITCSPVERGQYKRIYRLYAIGFFVKVHFTGDHPLRQLNTLARQLRLTRSCLYLEMKW